MGKNSFNSSLINKMKAVGWNEIYNNRWPLRTIFDLSFYRNNKQTGLLEEREIKNRKDFDFHLRKKLNELASINKKFANLPNGNL